MTGGGPAPRDDGAAAVSHSRSSLVLKDLLLSTTRRLSSNKLQRFSSRSQEHIMHDQTNLYPPIPLPDQAVSTATTAFLDAGDPTARLRCRTSSLTLDAAGRGSKESDSGNSSLMDSSSADSYQELGSDTRSRTTSSCKSDQSLASDHHHDHQDLFDQRRKRNSSMTDSISSNSSSGKVSLNASDTTETLEVVEINRSSSRDNSFIHQEEFPESQPFLCHPTHKSFLDTEDFERNHVYRSTDAIDSFGYSRQYNEHFPITDESTLFFSPFSSTRSNFTVNELSNFNRAHDKTRYCSFKNDSFENKPLLTSGDVLSEAKEDLLADLSWQSGTTNPRRSCSWSHLPVLPLNHVQQLDEKEVLHLESACSSRHPVDLGLNQAADISASHDHHLYSTHSSSTAHELLLPSSTQPDSLVASPAAESPHSILVTRQLNPQSSPPKSPQSRADHLFNFDPAQSLPQYPDTQAAIPSTLHQPNSKDKHKLNSLGNPPKHSNYSNIKGENSLARTDFHESLLPNVTPKKTSPRMLRPRTPKSASLVARNPVQNLKSILGCGSPVSSNALQQKIESCPGGKAQPLQVLVPSYKPPAISHSKSTCYTTDHKNRCLTQSFNFPLPTSENPQKRDAPHEIINNISRTVSISQIKPSHTLPNFKSPQILENDDQSENRRIPITLSHCEDEVSCLNASVPSGQRCGSTCYSQCVNTSLHSSLLRPKTHNFQKSNTRCPLNVYYHINRQNFRHGGNKPVFKTQNSSITSDMPADHSCPTLSTRSDNWPVDSNQALHPQNPNSPTSLELSYYWSQPRAACPHCTLEIDSSFGQDGHPNLDCACMPYQNTNKDSLPQAHGVYTEKNLEPAPNELRLLDDELHPDAAMEDMSKGNSPVKLDLHSSSVELDLLNKAQHRNCIRTLDPTSQPALYKSGEGEDNNNQEQHTLLDPIIFGSSKTQPQTTGPVDFFQREIPDYKFLCLAAAILNPVLGLLALVCNQQARINIRRHRPTRANNFYFATITLSTVAIFLTLMGVALFMAQHLVLTSGQPNPTPDPFSDQTCHDRFFLSDDILLKFYQVDRQLYCRITLNVKLMEALKNYHLQHITSKLRHAKQQNMTLTDLGLSSPDLIREAAGFKPGEILTGPQDQSFANFGTVEIVNKSKGIEEISSSSSGESGATDDLFPVFHNGSTKINLAESKGYPRGDQSDEIMTITEAKENAGLEVNSDRTNFGDNDYLSPSSDPGNNFVTELPALNATEQT